MKIGILTYHRSINNGAVMQCYSLATRLKKEFPEDEIEVIDYHMPLVDNCVYDISLKKYFKGSLKNIIVSLLRLKDIITRLKHDRLRKEKFESVLHYLPLSETRIYSDSMSELEAYINTNYDIVVAGSDAIWNYVVRGFPNPYFLSEKIKCIKVSYAASCYGMNYENIEQNQRNAIKQIFDSYHFLGTRDEESEKFVRYLDCSINPIHTCDPTAFLDVNNLPIDSHQLVSLMKYRGFDFSKESIAVMGDKKMCKMLRKMFGNKYQLVSLYNYNSECDVNLNDISPYEWAYVFRFFNLTVTTYFHGTMLSLRNGIPVVCIALQTDYSKTHMTKVEDLLLRLDLRDYYFETDYNRMNSAKIKETIDKLMKINMSSTLKSKMNKEAENFDTFLRYIKSLH